MMSSIDCLISIVFTHRNLQELHECNLLETFKSYSQVLFQSYCNKYRVSQEDLHLIEFICIRLIYLGLHLDEVSSHRTLFELPMTEVNKLIPKGWFNSSMLTYEINALKLCDYNPIRFCKEYVGDICVPTSPLYSPKKMIEKEIFGASV